MTLRSIAKTLTGMIVTRVTTGVGVPAVHAVAKTLTGTVVKRVATAVHVPAMQARVRTFAGRVRATSRPVWTFLAVEAVVTAGVLTLAAVWVDGLVRSVDLDRFPPWRALAVFPLLGAAGYMLRSGRPVQALRRWHGVLIRRVDQRWAAER